MRLGLFVYEYGYTDEDGNYIKPKLMNDLSSTGTDNYYEDLLSAETESNAIVEDSGSQDINVYVDIHEVNQSGEIEDEDAKPVATNWNKDTQDLANEKHEGNNLSYDDEGELTYANKVEEISASNKIKAKNGKLSPTQYYFDTYTYSTNPDMLPVNWEESMVDDYDEIVKSAGFNPEDEEVSVGYLKKDWNGHQKGAIVVSEMTEEGHSFAVENIYTEDITGTNKKIQSAKMTDEAQKFISNKIKYLMEKEGMEQKQAIAVAYSMAKKEGFDVPKKTKANDKIKAEEVRSWKTGSRSDMFDIMTNIIFGGDYKESGEQFVQAMSDDEFFENYEFIKRMHYDEEIDKMLEYAEKEHLS
jgi:hypothetical protein